MFMRAEFTASTRPLIDDEGRNGCDAILRHGENDGNRSGQVFLLLLVGATAAWMNLASLHESEHADSLLLVLVSTQRLDAVLLGTGPVRYAAAAPGDAGSPTRAEHGVPGIPVNGSRFLLAPFLVARFCPEIHWLRSARSTNVRCCSVASREVQFDWFCNQPYGLAMTLGFGGLVRARGRATAGSPHRGGAAHRPGALGPGGRVRRPRAAILLRRPSMIVVSCSSWWGDRRCPARELRLRRTRRPRWRRLPYGHTDGSSSCKQPRRRRASGFVDRARRCRVCVTLCCCTGLIAIRSCSRVSRWCRTDALARRRRLGMGADESLLPRYIFPSLMMLGSRAVTPIALPRRPGSPYVIVAGFLIGTSAIALLVTSMSVYGMPSWRRLHAGLDERFGRMTADVMASTSRDCRAIGRSGRPLFHANAALYRETAARACSV